jgi:hypothetical protein
VDVAMVQESNVPTRGPSCYFRKSDTTGKVVLGFGAGIATLSVFLERDSGVRPLAVEVDLNRQVALRNRNIKTYASLSDLPRLLARVSL